ncbi:MAG: chromate transporter [Eubacteriales bacterium]
MIYFDLFISFLQIGMFSFGGGMAAMPLIQAQVVDKHGWLTLTEFTDLITIAEMTPGPIAVNSATFVGIQVAGFGGALIATLGCVLPSCIIVLTLAWLYTKYKEMFILQGALSGLRPAVVSLIASAGVTILVLALFGEEGISAGVESLNYVSFGLFSIGLFILRKWKSTNPIKVMIGCGVIGGVLYLLLDMV